MTGLGALGSCCLLGLIYTVGLYYNQDYLAQINMPFSVSVYTLTGSVPFLVGISGDSLLSKTYRVGKSTVAAFVPVAEKIGKSMSRFFSKQHK